LESQVAKPPSPDGSPPGASPPSPPPTAGGDETTRTAGRGGIAIAAAKLYFILVGLVQQIALKRVLGLAPYGDLGQIQSFASILYNPVISAGLQGVSRAVSGSPPEDQAAAQRRAIGIHMAAVVPPALLLFVFAEPIAELLHARHLTLGMRIVAAVVLSYGLYAPFVGALNGHRRFGHQAALDALAATLRTVGLLGGAALFAERVGGVAGALSGFVASTTIMIVVAFALAGLGRRGSGGPSLTAYLRFIAPLFGGQFLLNLLMQADLQLLAIFAGEAATRSGLDAEAAGTLKGAYRAAQLFCFLPYQLLLSVAFVLFPLLAAAVRDGDQSAIARYVKTGSRVALVIAGLIVSVTASLPGPLLRLVFDADAASLGARAMLLMALGLGCFAIFGILTTVLNSLGRERTALWLTAGALALVGLGCLLLVRGQPFGEDMVVRTAMATGAGLAVATVGAVIAVHRHAGASLPPLSALRVCGALTLTIVGARFLPAPGALATLVYAALIGALYLAILVVSRELGRDDLALVTRVFRRKRS
jgi:stage V sporulation protein B